MFDLEDKTLEFGVLVVGGYLLGLLAVNVIISIVR